MEDLLHGTFHFHSTYSHDGRSTLSEIATSLCERGFSFCVMTEHFEDFDPQKFERYKQEITETSSIFRSRGFVLIPGIEVNLSGLDTIVFPVREFSQITQLLSKAEDPERRLFKVLAHPTKYSFEAVVRHLAKYEINGIELWNQQADGRHMPPLGFFRSVRAAQWRNQERYFFGCDLHNVNLTVSNIISIDAKTPRTCEAIVDALINGEFRSRNVPTGIEYHNGPERTDFETWLQTLLEKPYYQGNFLQGVRYCLRAFYRALPRRMQKSVNDLKNSVRNKL